MNLQSLPKFIILLILYSFTLGLIVYLLYFKIFDYTSFNGERIIPFGFKNETLILINVGLLFLFLTKRFLLSFLLTISIYTGFILINLEKIHYFNSTFVIQDILYVNQLMMIWSLFQPYLIVVFSVILFVIGLIILFVKYENPDKYIKQSGLIQKTLTFAMVFIISIKASGLDESMISLASKEGGRSHLVSSSEKFGLLTTFVRNAIRISQNNEPENYTLAEIEKIYREKVQSNQEKHPEPDSEEKVNLVIYLIESFIDPDMLGIKSTKDPIPFFHELQKHHISGFAFSPEIGGRSANAEFEILTGFYKNFFSDSSIPFIDIPYRQIPSIAQELRDENYYTKVIQTVSLGYFNYRQAYSMLGFEEINSISGAKGVILDSANRFPSDLSLVDKIIKSSEGKSPFFIYTFPNSTHGPWDYDAFKASDINLTSEMSITSADGKIQLRNYLNALNQSDIALKKLITHFDNGKEKTVILVLGDHQPGMPEVREQFLFRKYPNLFKSTNRKLLKKEFNEFFKGHPLETYQNMHITPYIIWSNFEINETVPQTLGMNELAINLFEIIKHQPKSGFYRFLKYFFQNSEYTDLIKFTLLDGEGLNNNRKDWVQSYEMIQYDILLGKNFLHNLTDSTSE